MRNLNFWNDPAIVHHYTKHRGLHALEIKLMGLQRGEWGQSAMLDIGIGVGRTTVYFAELAGRYEGIDYSPGMVTYCQERFGNRWPHATFRHQSAVDLGVYQDGEFQTVLFSFNGIDNLDWGDRAKAIGEMKRVCAKGGWVVYSSHSFYRIPVGYRFDFKLSPRHLVEEFGRWRTVRRFNEPITSLVAPDRNEAMFCDAAVGHNKMAFVRPDRELDMLLSLGFSRVAVLSTDGEDITGDPEELRSSRHSYVGYLCQV